MSVMSLSSLSEYGLKRGLEREVKCRAINPSGNAGFPERADKSNHQDTGK